MQYRKFGDMGSVSALGFGAMRFPTENGVVCEDEAIKIVRHAIDSGVNYIDTAYFYHGGESEKIVGKALADGYRKKVMLATKSPIGNVKTAEDFDRVFEEQLEKLGTDYIDCYLFHATNEDKWENIILPQKLVQRMQKLRADGRVKHIGFSFHDNLSAFKRIVDEFEGCDFCQIQLNYIDIKNQAGIEGLEYAAKKGLGVVIMEPLLGGKLATASDEVTGCVNGGKSAVQMALDFLWDRKEVSLVLSGMSNFEQVKQNLEYANESGIGKLTEKQREGYKRAKKIFDSKRSVACTKCRYCMPCPAGLDIPHIFEVCNSGADRVYSIGKAQYDALPVRSDSCRACRMCEEKCPQKLEISSLMAEINEYYGG